MFGYLAWRSAHNRVARQVRHLRSPRYVAALLLGLTYLWFVVIAQRPAPAVGGLADPRWLELVGALALLGAVAWGWIFGVERRVLAFSPAEVTFLFSGPVSRRGLIQFKLLRSQLLILFNALLWTLILSRERFGMSPWLRVLFVPNGGPQCGPVSFSTPRVVSSTKAMRLVRLAPLGADGFVPSVFPRRSLVWR